jgi:hypothetical protein
MHNKWFAASTALRIVCTSEGDSFCASQMSAVCVRGLVAATRPPPQALYGFSCTTPWPHSISTPRAPLCGCTRGRPWVPLPPCTECNWMAWCPAGGCTTCPGNWQARRAPPPPPHVDLIPPPHLLLPVQPERHVESVCWHDCVRVGHRGSSFPCWLFDPVYPPTPPPPFLHAHSFIRGRPFTQVLHPPTPPLPLAALCLSVSPPAA